MEEVSLIQEKREQLERMEKPPDILLAPITELNGDKLKERLTRTPTDEERTYMRLSHEIEEYNKNRESQPDRYERWDDPRFRLSRGFLNFVNEHFEEE